MRILKSLRPYFLTLFCLLFSFQAVAKKGGMGSGGGNFTVPVFWERVENEIIPLLKTKKAEKTEHLTAAQIDSILALMKRNLVTVKLVEEPLYFVINGKKNPVDALNYPSKRLIELHKPTWQAMVNGGYDVNHLILHEFMGLAVIDDKNGLSTKLIPPRRRPLVFKSNQLQCDSTLKYISLRNGSYVIRDMPMSENILVNLSPAARLNPNPKCYLQDPQTKQCLRYANDYKTKTAEVTIPLEIDESDTLDGRYIIEGTINFISDYYGFGWGAAANTLFLRNASLNIIWKLVHYDSSNRKKVLTLLTSETEETDEYRDVATVSATIPIPAFVELLEKNGFKISLAPYRGEITSPFHSYNVAGLLDQFAKKSGAKTEEERDSFIMGRVLAGMVGTALAFRSYVQCTLLAE